MTFPSEGPYFIAVKGRTKCKVTDTDEGLLAPSAAAHNTSIPTVGVIIFIFTQTANKEIAFYKSLQRQQKHTCIITYFSRG